MNRFQQVYNRYGWRMPFITLAIFLRRNNIYSILTLFLLHLTTKGYKGKNLLIENGFFVSPGGILELGDNLYLGRNSVFEISVNPPGRVTIGNNVWISRDCHLSSCSSIVIGDNVSIGEFVSIRDTTHSYKWQGVPIREQTNQIGKVVIENDAWIGRGSLLQSGHGTLVIGEGAIVAANSVVKQSIPKNEVWGGAPARYLKKREQATVVKNYTSEIRGNG